MGLKVKVESPAERCEICHQADEFDPSTDKCLRCDGLLVVIPVDDQDESTMRKQSRFSWSPLQVNVAIGIVVLFLFVAVEILIFATADDLPVADLIWCNLFAIFFVAVCVAITTYIDNRIKKSQKKK